MARMSSIGRKRNGNLKAAPLACPGKERRVEARNFPSCCMNRLYTADDFQNNLTKCWRNSRPFTEDDSSVQLLTSPFQCCVIPNFISESDSRASAESDSSSELPNTQRSNLSDSETSAVTNNGTNTHAIARFGTCSSSLAGSGSEMDHGEKNVGKVQDGVFLKDLVTELLLLKFYENSNDLYQFHQSDDLKTIKSSCVSALRRMFHEEVLPWLRSVTGLELTDTIDMTCSKYEYTDMLLCHDDQLEGRKIAFIFYLVPEWLPEDGGSLDLFDTNVHGQPRGIIKSLLPARNSFVFFEVNAMSFHQVSEVLTAGKTRLSVNGWFHGPPSPSPGHPPYKPLPLPMDMPISLGLDVLSQWVSPVYLDIGVQAQIQHQFEVKSQIQLPDFLMKEKYQTLCEELLACGQQGRWSVEGAPNRKHVEVMSPGELPPLCHAYLNLVTSKPFCLLLAHMTELELIENVKLDHGASLLNVDSGTENAKELKSSTVEADSDSLELKSTALCRGDWFRWRAGGYNLAGDPTDPGLGRFCLEAISSFNSEGWLDEFGGAVSFIAESLIAEDADEEFLKLVPAPNTLSLVYRDKDLLRFVKYVNHRSLSSPSQSFHTLAATYIESTEHSSTDGDDDASS